MRNLLIIRDRRELTFLELEPSEKHTDSIPFDFDHSVAVMF